MQGYEFKGGRVALACLLMIAVLLALEPIRISLLYSSEAPLGYERLTFEELFESDSIDGKVGKRICLKGYPVSNDSFSDSVYRSPEMFLFSASGNSFVTGNTLLVEVNPERQLIAEPLAISGVLMPFHSDYNGIENVRYIMKDVVIRKSKTNYQLSKPSHGGC